MGVSTGWFVSLVPSYFSTKKKINNQPIRAAVPVYPVTKKGRDWLLGGFFLYWNWGSTGEKNPPCITSFFASICLEDAFELKYPAWKCNLMLIGSVFLVREIDGAPSPAREETNTLCFGNDPGFCQPGRCIVSKQSKYLKRVGFVDTKFSFSNNWSFAKDLW